MDPFQNSLKCIAGCFLELPLNQIQPSYIGTRKDGFAFEDALHRVILNTCNLEVIKYSLPSNLRGHYSFSGYLRLRFQFPF